MKIEILNPDEFKKLFKSWGMFACQCYNTPDKYAERVGKSCLETGHTSGSRSRFIEVRVSEVSRAMVDQLVRHEQGVVKNVQSQRYVFDDFSYSIDPVIANNAVLNTEFEWCMEQINLMRINFKAMIEEETNLKGEKVNQVVRGLNPMAIHSAVTIAFDVEALIHLAHERKCTCSQPEISEFANMVCDEAIKLVPELNKHLVPKCEYLLWCPESEKRSCGRKPTKIKLIEMINSLENK